MDRIQSHVWCDALTQCTENAATLETWMQASEWSSLCYGRKLMITPYSQCSVDHSHMRLGMNPFPTPIKPKEQLKQKFSLLTAACARGSLGTCIRLYQHFGLGESGLGIAINEAARRGHLIVLGWLIHCIMTGKNCSKKHSNEVRLGLERGDSCSCIFFSYPIRDLTLDMYWNCEISLHSAAAKGHVHVCKWFSDIGLLRNDKFYRCHAFPKMFTEVALLGQLESCRWVLEQMKYVKLSFLCKTLVHVSIHGNERKSLMCKFLCDQITALHRNKEVPQVVCNRATRRKQYHIRHDKRILFDIFVDEAEEGHLDVCQCLVQYGNVDPSTDKWLVFRRACSAGHLNICQWLYSLGMTLDDVQVYHNVAWRSTEDPHIMEWLKSLGITI